MKIIYFIFFLMIGNKLRAQQQNTVINDSEAGNLEDLSESSETESEDEYDMQQRMSYIDHPVNINAAEAALNEFSLLEPLQIENILKYRQLLGNFISIYELQCVPGFSVELIKKLLPYITVADNFISIEKFIQRFHSGERVLIARPSIIPEIAKGFSSGTSPSQKYTGGRAKMLIRYKYQYRDLLQYGIVADQDAGEQFLFRKQQSGFDFYSFHLFARKIGPIKAISIGDYTVNLGQGLLHWQSQAFKKSSGVINIKRQSETLRPYHSAGEYNFLRGTGVTLKKGNLESTLFVSYRKLSANIDYNDQQQTVITSLLTSGLHRTMSEIANRNAAAMVVTGGNIKWQKEIAHIGLNAVQYRYSLPLLKRDVPYNLYSIKERTWAGYSLDYSFTYHNYHVFGECSMDKNFNPAMVSGVMASLDPSIDIAILFRSINRAYQSIYGNAFTESTLPSNESGIYAGVSFRPSQEWKIDVYADQFSFPWLRYRADAPGSGAQYLVQVIWQPDKRIEVYTRFRLKQKAVNETLPLMPSQYPQDKLLKNWRTNISFQVNRSLLLRNRIEFCWFGEPEVTHPQTGFLLYTDLLYKPFGKSYSLSARFQVFETGGYETRLYAYENDVLFANSTPAYFDKGAKVYINIKTKIEIKRPVKFSVSIGLKAATTLYTDNLSVGSGQDEIAGKRKSEIKFQMFFSPG
jgi:hypothetical protein